LVFPKAFFRRKKGLKLRSNLVFPKAFCSSKKAFFPQKERLSQGFLRSKKAFKRS